MAAIDLAWEDIKVSFGLEDHRNKNVLKPLSPPTIEFLKNEGLIEGILDYLQAEVEQRLRVDVAPSFWRHFKHGIKETDDEDELSNKFQTAVNDLSFNSLKLLPLVKGMDSLASECNFKVDQYGQTSYQELYWLFLKGTLHSQLPNQDYRKPIRAFYARAFHVFNVRRDSCGVGNMSANSSMEQDDEEEEHMKCEGCKKELPNRCDCNAIMASFHDVNKKLLELKLLERLTGDVVTIIVRQMIEKYVEETTKGSYSASYIKSLSDWLEAVVMMWIRLIYSADTAGVACSEEINLTLESFRQRLSHFLYETYTKARINQLWSIIINFPESQQTVEDLRDCMEMNDLRPVLTQTLKKVFETKLLHLGVNTTDILTAYIQAIKALRVLDPTSVLLEIVCEPVKRYLRSREDTVRCIVQSLIDQDENDLKDELLKNEGLCLDDSYIADDLNDPDELEATWETWTPDPIDADLTTKLR